jgi:endonuclease YncB( thermonuclease family)
MKKLLSLLLLACLTISAFAGCGVGDQGSSSSNSEFHGPSTNTSSSDTEDESSDTSSSDTDSGDSSSEQPDLGEQVDYVDDLKLDMNNGAQHLEVTLKQHIDGDTTHFYADLPFVDNGVLKARYIAINTPESTGTIEPWGKKASNFTKSKLSTATSIILETDGTEWEADSTGDRYLVWVWYKAPGETDYRNLNLEILQEGLAVGNKAGQSRYGTLCTQAISQAKKFSLNCHSKEKDPDFFYGEAIELDLKELRTNVEAYNGKRVAFEGTVTVYHDWNVYVEDYDEATDMYYGISVFYGYNGQLHEPLAPGNRVRIVGKVSYYEAGGTYQISDLKYDLMDEQNPNNTFALESGHNPAYKEVTLAQFNGNVNIDREEKDLITGEMVTVTKSFAFAEMAMSTSVSMKGLTVIDAYTTNNGGANQGAISLTCKDASGKTITVRTVPLYENGVLVTQDKYLGKTIDVKGIVDKFDGEYQIKVFWVGNIVVK